MDVDFSHWFAIFIVDVFEEWKKINFWGQKGFFDTLWDVFVVEHKLLLIKVH